MDDQHSVKYLSQSEERETPTEKEEYDERYAFVLNMKTANNKDKAIMWLKKYRLHLNNPAT